MKYKYTAIAGAQNIDGRITKRPIVDIEISNGKHARAFVALIDSGADQISMPVYIAELFGIEKSPAQERPMMGISMVPVRGFVGTFTIQIY